MARCTTCQTEHDGLRVMPDGSAHVSRTADDDARGAAAMVELRRRIAAAQRQIAERPR